MTDLEELERLLEKATPGPWEAIGTDPAEGGDWFWIKPQPSPALRGFTEEIGAVNGSQSDPQQQANAALIVALRNAAPSLIAEVEALRGEVARLREALTPSQDTKYCYSAKFEQTITLRDEDGEEYSHPVTIEWTTIKQIMVAIEARAALGEDGK